jgi:hypothetical protein
MYVKRYSIKAIKNNGYMNIYVGTARHGHTGG